MSTTHTTQKRTKTPKVIMSMEDIKSFEHASAKVSHKYVPIKTSDFVQSLSDHFKLKVGRQYRYGSTGHYVEMTRTGSEDVSLYIENSFDRTLALRMSFNYNGFVFGRIRQVHRGLPAHAIIGSIDEINTWYTNAIQSIESMRVMDIEKENMVEIADIVFKTRGVNLKMITNMRYDFDTVLDFVMYLVNGIKDGEFSRTSPTGIKMIKPLKQESVIIRINDKIWKYLSKHNPELYV